MSRVVIAREKVMLLARESSGWKQQVVERTIYGMPGRHYVRARSNAKLPVQWDAVLGHWAEVRPNE